MSCLRGLCRALWSSLTLLYSLSGTLRIAAALTLYPIHAGDRPLKVTIGGSRKTFMIFTREWLKTHIVVSGEDRPGSQTRR